MFNFYVYSLARDLFGSSIIAWKVEIEALLVLLSGRNCFFIFSYTPLLNVSMNAGFEFMKKVRLRKYCFLNRH